MVGYSPRSRGNTQDRLALRRYALADAIMKEANAPVASHAQGIAGLANAALGAHLSNKEDARQEQLATAQRERTQALIRALIPGMPSPDPQQVPPAPGTQPEGPGLVERAGNWITRQLGMGASEAPPPAAAPVAAQSRPPVSETPPAGGLPVPPQMPPQGPPATNGGAPPAGGPLSDPRVAAIIASLDSPEQVASVILPLLTRREAPPDTVVGNGPQGYGTYNRNPDGSLGALVIRGVAPGSTRAPTETFEDATQTINGVEVRGQRSRLTGRFYPLDVPAGMRPREASAPAGYRWSADGATLEPIPGGPAEFIAGSTRDENGVVTHYQIPRSSLRASPGGVQPPQPAPDVIGSNSTPAAVPAAPAASSSAQPAPPDAEAVPAGPNLPPGARVTGRTERPVRPLTEQARNNLQERGGNLSVISNAISSFRPEFAGYVSEMAGNAATTRDRNLPAGWLGANPDRAAFWQNYDRYKNQIRNQLFGSALTATEQAAFERADVNPSMQPEVVQRNLNLQQQIVSGAIGRLARSMVQDGYSVSAVEQALGVRLDTLPNPLAGTPGQVPAPQEAQAAPSQERWQRGPDGRLRRAQ